MPRDGQLIFFGDKAAEAAYGAALKRWTALGATLVGVRSRAVLRNRAAALRRAVGRGALSRDPQSAGVVAGCDPSGHARDHHRGRAAYRRRHFRRAVPAAGAAHGSPSAPSPTSTRWCCRPRRPSIRRRRCSPIRSSSTSRLGTYTNFVNLLDLCGLALPAAIRPDDIPFGITLLAPAGQDARLASIGRVFQADTKLTLGRAMRAAAAACGSLCEPERRRHRDRGGRRASFGDGAQRRIEDARADD